MNVWKQNQSRDRGNRQADANGRERPTFDRSMPSTGTPQAGRHSKPRLRGTTRRLGSNCAQQARSEADFLITYSLHPSAISNFHISSFGLKVIKNWFGGVVSIGGACKEMGEVDVARSRTCRADSGKISYPCHARDRLDATNKTLEKVLRGSADANIRFAELRTLLLKLGFGNEYGAVITYSGRAGWKKS